VKKIIILIVSILLFSATYATCISSKNLCYDKIYIIPSITKTEISKTDSIKNVDKKNVIEKVVHEVFTNYYDSIKSLRKDYSTISVMSYINTYIKKQNDTIESRISNKSYIHRFAATEKLWIDTDFSEVAALIKVRTLDRIKEISEDVDRKVLNVLNTITNDKELLLEKEVREEIKE